ncbi:hypothetical protein pb186bvf_018889 [Paramecium bursaria]
MNSLQIYDRYVVIKSENISVVRKTGNFYNFDIILICLSQSFEYENIQYKYYLYIKFSIPTYILITIKKISIYFLQLFIIYYSLEKNNKYYIFMYIIHKRCKELEIENQLLKDQIEILTGSFEKLETFMNDINQESKYQITKIDAQLQETINQVNIYEKQIIDYQNEIKQYDQQIQNISLKLEDLQNENNKLKEEIDKKNRGYQHLLSSQQTKVSSPINRKNIKKTKEFIGFRSQIKQKDSRIRYYEQLLVSSINRNSNTMLLHYMNRCEQLQKDVDYLLMKQLVQ